MGLSKALARCHKGSLDHFYDFWIQKSHHFYDLWIQKFIGPFLQLLDPETAVFLRFLDPEIAPFLQYLDPEIFWSIFTISGSINCSISAVYGSRNNTISATSGLPMSFISKKTLQQQIKKFMPSSVSVNSISIDWTEIALILIISTPTHASTRDSYKERSQEFQTLQASLCDEKYTVQVNFEN